MLIYPYADLRFADDFTDSFSHLEDWNLLDECQQSRYLLDATLLIDSAYRYIGDKPIGQMNEFPRAHQKIVPNEIRTACVLIAFDCFKADRSALASSGVQRDGAVIEERIDDMVIKYASGETRKSNDGIIQNEVANRLLKRFIKRMYR